MKNMKKVLMIIIVLVFSLIVLGGCGGGEGSSPDWSRCAVCDGYNDGKYDVCSKCSARFNGR